MKYLSILMATLLLAAFGNSDFGRCLLQWR